MAETPQSAGADGARRFLTFRRDSSLYALPAEEVAEVIRMPAVARVPQGPPGLLGIANLRGSVLPVASLTALLGLDVSGVTQTTRAIVLSGAVPVALAVDSVDALVSVDAEDMEVAQAMMAAEPGERLRGAFRAGQDRAVVKVLDIQNLLATAFAQRAARPARYANAGGQNDSLQDLADTAVVRDKLVSFEIAGQEYALGLDAVREIIPVPEWIVLIPHSDAPVLGVVSYRHTLLSLFSLRALLGFPPALTADGKEKIVISVIGGVLAGLVVDRMRDIMPSDPALIEPIPLILAARTGGEARTRAIYRGESGKRLISVLAPEVLFREEIMKRLGTAAHAVDPGDNGQERDAGETRTFLVFRLGDDEFGLPIEVVNEIAHVPVQITKVPNTPDFLEGVINLRGDVLAVVDQRRRFGMSALEDGSRRRLVVVQTAHHRAGLIVDSVSEMLRSDADAIAEAPDLSGQARRLVNGVVNLPQADRIILVLDPAELLTRAERALLDAFQVETGHIAS